MRIISGSLSVPSHPVRITIFQLTAANSNGKNALGALKLQATTADTVAKDIAKYQTIAGTDKNTYIADTAKSNYDATIEQYNTAIEKLKTSNAELEEKNKKTCIPEAVCGQLY